MGTRVNHQPVRVVSIVSWPRVRNPRSRHSIPGTCMRVHSSPNQLDRLSEAHAAPCCVGAGETFLRVKGPEREVI